MQEYCLLNPGEKSTLNHSRGQTHKGSVSSGKLAHKQSVKRYFDIFRVSTSANHRQNRVTKMLPIFIYKFLSCYLLLERARTIWHTRSDTNFGPVQTQTSSLRDSTPNRHLCVWAFTPSSKMFSVFLSLVYLLVYIVDSYYGFFYHLYFWYCWM